MRRTIAAAVLTCLLALTAACGGDEGDAGDQATGAPACASVDAPAAREDGGESEPEERLDPEVTYTLVFETSCGSFTITLDQETAPATAASFVSLARNGFFDDTIFHRVVPGFVIQGGDPTQTGAGGPGYQTVDPPPVGVHYVRGDVAMAKAATEPAGTAGSQFFIVTGDDIGLPAEYAIVGEVTDGLDVVMAIDALGDAGTELPTRPVVIESVKVGESG